MVRAVWIVVILVTIFTVKTVIIVVPVSILY